MSNHVLVSSSGKRRRNRKGMMSESEIMTILVSFHFSHCRVLKHIYLHEVCIHLHYDFPHIVSYNRFVELESHVFFKFMFFLKMYALGHCTGITYVYSTTIPVCNNIRRYADNVFKWFARNGKGTMGWFHGFKLHFTYNDTGKIIFFCLTRANVDDKSDIVWKVLAKDLYGKSFADRGYISQNLFNTLFVNGVNLVTVLRCKMKNELMLLWDKIMLCKRILLNASMICSKILHNSYIPDIVPLTTSS